MRGADITIIPLCFCIQGIFMFFSESNVLVVYVPSLLAISQQACRSFVAITMRVKYLAMMQ